MRPSLAALSRPSLSLSRWRSTANSSAIGSPCNPWKGGMAHARAASRTKCADAGNASAKVAPSLSVVVRPWQSVPTGQSQPTHPPAGEFARPAGSFKPQTAHQQRYGSIADLLVAHHHSGDFRLEFKDRLRAARGLAIHFDRRFQITQDVRSRDDCPRWLEAAVGLVRRRS